MEWIKRWIFGKDSSRQLSKKQQTQKNAQEKYLSETLAFAKAQYDSLAQKQREHDAWQHKYGLMHVNDLQKLNGIEFEGYLSNLYKQHGYLVETTPKTGDFGADLILAKNNLRIAIQAKCYTGSVGVSAVQEALSGMAYYHCNHAWVVTTGTYTVNAIKLAKQSKVRLIGPSELGKLIVQKQHYVESNG